MLNSEQNVEVCDPSLCSGQATLTMIVAQQLAK